MNLVDYIKTNDIQENIFSDLTEQTHVYEDWDILIGLICYDKKDNVCIDVAYKLLQEYGSLPTILSQSALALQRIEGVTPEIAIKLELVKRAATLIAEKRILQKSALNNWQAIENYCRTMIGYNGRENLMAIYLDAEFRPIRAEQVSKGTVNKVAAYPRDIIARVLQLDAYSIIIAKNIPTGRLSAKPCEVEVATKLKDVCERIDVHFMDAVLVGKSGVRSMLKQ